MKNLFNHGGTRMHTDESKVEAVAQIFNLLYRGFAIRLALETAWLSESFNPQPNAIRRYSRFQICATP